MVIIISHQDVVCHGSRVSVLKNIRYLVVGGGSEKRVMLEDAGCLRERYVGGRWHGQECCCGQHLF